RLLHRTDQRAARRDDELMRADDAGAVLLALVSGLLEELAVDRDVAGAGDLAAAQHAVGSDDELGAATERDGALLEEALDLDGRAFVELEARVSEHVAAAEVAAV